MDFVDSPSESIATQTEVITEDDDKTVSVSKPDMEYLDNGKDFDYQQFEFTELYKENGKTISYNRNLQKGSTAWKRNG